MTYRTYVNKLRKGMQPKALTKAKKQPKALTKAKKRAYVKQGGSACPYCGNDAIEGDSYEHGEGFISQRVDCTDCRRYWFDEYTLSGIIEGVDLP
jgi:hypothetical protein